MTEDLLGTSKTNKAVYLCDANLELLEGYLPALFDCVAQALDRPEQLYAWRLFFK